MAKMEKDLQLNDENFMKASTDMNNLKTRTQTFKKDLENLYNALQQSLNCLTGKEVELQAKNVLLKPVDNMELVVGHISSTLQLVIGGNYYKDVFDGFDELKNIL